MEWRNIRVPLSSGIDTRVDERALQAPALTDCQNGEFTELGGIQKRKPLSALPTGVGSGVTTLADLEVRRILSHNGELLAFTREKLLAFSEGAGKWIERGEHLAVVTEEETAFARSAEQAGADYVEHSGLGFFAWIERITDTPTFQVHTAIVDLTSGSTLQVGPYGSASANVARPRLAVTTNRVFLVYRDDTGVLIAYVGDPADEEDTWLNANDATLATQSVDYDAMFDVKGAGAEVIVVWRSSTAGQYRVALVTEGAVATVTTKVRDCTGPIAVAARGTAPSRQFMIIRSNVSGGAAVITADLLGNALADVNVNTSVGSTLPPFGAPQANQVTAAFRSVAETGGEFRCLVFWVTQQSTGQGDFASYTNYVDTNAAIGTQSALARRVGIVSHAVDRGGRVFVWLGFSGETPASFFGQTLGFRAQLQNSYFLYREDGLLVGKAVAFEAGGFSQEDGYLPGVQSLGSDAYVWCGIERRVIELGGDHTGYAARTPRRIRFSFDSDLARRAVTLGKTLYISGAQIKQYDGTHLAEVGFHVYPWFTESLTGGGGTLEAGDRAYKSTLEWENAQGEIDRSTTATAELVTVAANDRVTVSFVPLHVTLKQGALASPAIIGWRTEANPFGDSPFQMITDPDPSATTGDNRYLENDPTADFVVMTTDDFADTVLREKRIDPENGGALASTAPPPASIVVAGQERIFLAGIPNQPHRIAYSKLRGVGEVAAFNDLLLIDLPHDGGKITGLAVINETLVAFKERATFVVPGFGHDNIGGGQNYGPPSLIAPDVGAISQDAIAVTPDGAVFLSEKGWHLLDRSFTARYIGGPVHDFDDDDFVSVKVLEDRQEVRCLSTSRLLVFDYVANEWAVWGLSSQVDTAIHDGVFHLASAGGVSREDANHGNATNYSLTAETAWIKLTEGMQGFGRVRRILVGGEYRSAHDLKIEVAKDYETAFFDEKTWTVAPVAVGGFEQVRHSPSIQKMQAIKIRITDRAVGADTPPLGEGLKLNEINLEVGYKSGSFKGLPAAQKQ